MSETPRRPPGTYAEWVPLLDKFASGDDSLIAVMRNGSITWSSVVAERWTMRVEQALTSRLRTLSSKLQQALDRSAGDLFGVSRTLLDVRREIGLLHEFAVLTCIPTNVQNHLAAQVSRFASEAQAGLERSAGQIRNDNGRLLKTIRDNPLRVPVSTGSVVAPEHNLNDSIPPARRRRVIL